MGTIVERRRTDGSAAFRAQIVIKDKGRIVHQEARTFDRRTTAKAWMDKREKELRAPGGLKSARIKGKTVADAIDKYLAENRRGIGKTKAQVLEAIKGFSLAEMACEDVASDDLVDFARALADGRGPSTVMNYLSHLSAIFAVARPAWGMPLDREAMRDAMAVCKRLGLTAKSRSRDRRPTRDELDRLMAHFEDRWRRGRSLPMHQVVAFALFSTRRQSEILSIRWDDLEAEHGRVLVRDMKHPGEKAGNDTWCELPAEALRIIQARPRKPDESRIFPYSTDAVSAAFTRACKLLEIDDLHFHDLRHEGVSRLFEMGKTIPQAASVSGHRSWQSLQRYSHVRATGDPWEGWAWLLKASTK